MKEELTKFSELAVFYKALAHPARLAIIEKLSNCEICTCSDLVARLPFAQATVSEHLRKLTQAKLILLKKRGSSSEYYLNRGEFEKIRKSKSVASFLHLSV